MPVAPSRGRDSIAALMCVLSLLVLVAGDFALHMSFEWDAFGYSPWPFWAIGATLGAAGGILTASALRLIAPRFDTFPTSAWCAGVIMVSVTALTLFNGLTPSTGPDGVYPPSLSGALWDLAQSGDFAIALPVMFAAGAFVVHLVVKGLAASRRRVA